MSNTSGLGRPHKILPGRLHKKNEGALAWGPHNLVAYACHSCVVIVDPHSMRIVQTLDEHRSPVVSVQWASGNENCDLDHSTLLSLASADASGTIIIWNVNDARILNTVTEESNTPIVDMKWHPEDPSLLLSLHSPPSLVLWNIKKETKLWKRDFSEPISSFEFDPFDASTLCLSADHGGIFFMKGFNPPVSVAQPELRFKVSPSSGAASAGSGGGTTAVLSPTPARKGSSRNAAPPAGEFVQSLFSPCTRHIMYFVLTREVLVFDTSTLQVIGSLGLERNRASFAGLVLCKEHSNLVFSLHDDGCVSAWERHSDDYSYELRCLSELVKFNKQNKKKAGLLAGLVNGPLNETTLAAVSTDGVLLTWQYVGRDPPRLVVTGMMDTLSSSISSMAVSPFSDGRLLALGTAQGTVQIVDMATSQVVKEFAVRGQAMRGIRWLSPHEVIAFATEELSKGSYRNFVGKLDIRTGRVSALRRTAGGGAEGSFIRGIRLSSGHQYLIVFLNDQPFELWNLRTLAMLRPVTPFLQITALEWAPLPADLRVPHASPPSDAPAGREQFVFTLPDGTVQTFVADHNNILPGVLQADLGVGIVSSLAWKGRFLVSGDTLGNLHCWDFEAKKAAVYATHKGVIRRIKFSPSSKAHHILVLFNAGEFALWDLDHGVRLATSNYLKGRDLKAIDIDWCSDTAPLVATSDGCLRLLDRSLSTANAPVALAAPSPPDMPAVLRAPYLLPLHAALALKVHLQHGCVECPPPTERDADWDRRLGELCRLLDQDFVDAVRSAKYGTAERCYLTARYFGDEKEVRFWSLALNLFNRVARAKTAAPSVGPPANAEAIAAPPSALPSEQTATNQASDTDALEAAAPESKEALKEAFLRLPRHFDLLLGNQQVRTNELKRTAINTAKRATYDQTKRTVELNLLLGQRSQAVELLQETPPTHPNYFADLLKACVVAAAESKEAFTRTATMVATNLIANSRLDDGVQLLCLVGKQLEACRYLQSYDRWHEAAWLAKTTLSDQDSAIVFERWADHLIACNQKAKAIDVLLMLGKVHEVLQLLHEKQRFDIAALFAECCRERGLLTPYGPEELKRSVLKNLIPLEQLLESIHLDYGFYLHRLGNNRAAELYWKEKAGVAGKNMMETVQATEDLKLQQQQQQQVVAATSPTAAVPQ